MSSLREKKNKKKEFCRRAARPINLGLALGSAQRPFGLISSHSGWAGIRSPHVPGLEFPGSLGKAELSWQAAPLGFRSLGLKSAQQPVHMCDSIKFVTEREKIILQKIVPHPVMI